MVVKQYKVHEKEKERERERKEKKERKLYKQGFRSNETTIRGGSIVEVKHDAQFWPCKPIM